jgi:hypothetical protein
MKARHIFSWMLSALVTPMLIAPASAQRSQAIAESKTPITGLLPRPPMAAQPIVLPDKLILVPEVEFQAREDRKAEESEVVRSFQERIAKIKSVNSANPDAFIRLLREGRSDLVGLPFQMDEFCRLEPSRWASFREALSTLRESSPGSEAELFWKQYRTALSEKDANHLPNIFVDKSVADLRRGRQANVESARVATLMQVLGPESEKMRLGLVEYLAGVAHIEARRALAKLVIFSEEKDVRDAALRALKLRGESDYTGILTEGLSYPWPPVAERAANAIIKLERKDLIPTLVGLVDQPDPRGPVQAGKTEVIRELVRINHHRNCLLCHAPGNADIRDGKVAAPIPLPTRRLSGGYFTQPEADLVVRIDVTYLRQDFSLMLPVDNSNPWPKMQRFDFLVRTREVNKQDAEAIGEALKRQSVREGTSPYNSAILNTLRALRGE